ncbi:MAG TPA: hypothetical protein VN541_25195, partial [Tepidisphaeraceae bacterium]|nr:hypothetical protein [Tepidisphaeraceae bacterium]
RVSCGVLEMQISFAILPQCAEADRTGLPEKTGAGRGTTLMVRARTATAALKAREKGRRREEGRGFAE